MNAPWTRRIPTALLLVIAANGVGRAGDPSAPQTHPHFRAGDTVTVALDSARIMLGQQVVGTLPHGHRVLVAEVRDGWVGMHAQVQGQQQSGWMRMSDFIPGDNSASPATAQAYAAYRPVVAESTPVVPYVCTAGPGVGDQFLIGRYQRHEVDPNMHVWEPWRYR